MRVCVCVALGLVASGLAIGLVLLLLFPLASCYKGWRRGRWEGGDVPGPITMGGVNQHDTARGGSGGDDAVQGHDMVMPGFRFHPTEEELIEFYLRRKVEGKRFNLELIVFVDLYRFDPWDLPAQASIGDKEWFFYVPRDRKYRNGDRPNRVTPTGYWKATGADRMVRVEGNRNIGLKKTLVFYVGKAPKGLRSSWIMNEYRLPHGEADRYHKEISLCRVYKRPGIDDNFHLIGTTTKSSVSKSSSAVMDRKHAAAANRTSAAARRLAPVMFVDGAGSHQAHHSSALMEKAYSAHTAPAEGANTAAMSVMSLSAAAATSLQQPASTMFRPSAAASGASPRSTTTSAEEDGASLYHSLKGSANPMHQHQHQPQLPSSTHALLNANSSTMATIPIDELSRAIAIGSYSQVSANPNQAMTPSQQGPLLPFPSMDRIWDWNPLLESPKVCTTFK